MQSCLGKAQKECVPSLHNACVSAATEQWLQAEDGERVVEYKLEREQNQS